MTLDELKAAWDAAALAAKADEKNESLAKAEADAKAAYDQAVEAANTPPPVDPEEQGWDEKTKAYIQKLRSENAGHRSKNKELASKFKTSEDQKKAMLKAAGIETDEVPPEQVIQSLSAESQTLAFSNAVLGIALQHGIPAEDVDFLEFAIQKAANGLGEGEELSDEALGDIVAKGKGRGGNRSSSTSVGTGGTGGGAPPPGETGKISLDDFCRMSITQKSNLFLKNAALYESLKNEAKAKKRFV